MYYHPRMFDWANGEQTFAARQAFLGVWLDGVARQQQAHADAVSMSCARQVKSVRGELIASHGNEMTRSVVWLKCSR